MSTLLRVFLPTVVALCIAGEVSAQSKPGSQLPEDENTCAMCHGQDIWEADQLRLHMPKENFSGDVHFENGVNCHDCHGGDPSVFDASDLHLAEDGFRDLAEVKESCAGCHREAVDLVKGVHAKAGAKVDGRGTPLECADCHGGNHHRILKAADSQSPVFLDHQIQTCGACHEKEQETYTESVHGHGLYKSGLLVTAACADCHGAHGTFRAPDKRSTLHPTNVAQTCGQCHRFIQERLEKSVHGSGNGPGGLAERAAPGGKVMQKPSCTSCHQEDHNLKDPTQAQFRLELPNRCGNCHADLSSRYAMSLHGQLTELGYGPAAKCSDCHGAHDILPISDPGSMLAAGNRLATCKECHPYAVENFSNFDPHADHHDIASYPILGSIYLAMELLVYAVFSFFGLHMVLWFFRSLVHTLKHGRPRRIAPGQLAYVRFEPIHRVLHVIVIVSFLGLALTGLPLKYSDQDWAKTLAFALGGFDSTSTWHHVCAVATFFYFAAHLVWMGKKIFQLRGRKVAWTRIVFGPDSPIPSLRDFQDLFRMGRWFVGQGPKPVFERWAYWEKFDYWAVFWGISIIGTSGLILWFPYLFTRFLPGEALNVAKIIHSEEALLATGFIFAIHFFHTHFRPEKFPIDMSMLTGLASVEDMKEERPELLERLNQESTTEESMATTPSGSVLWMTIIGGFLALAVGLSLLAGMIVASLGK